MNAVLHGVWPVGRVRTGELERVAVFALHAFLSLVIYYLLKTMRESILLESGSAELKSYAYAVVALVLLLGLPLYGVALRRLEPRSLLRWLTAVFAAGLVAFSIAAGAGIDVAFGYYVWVSVLGLVLLTQLWSHAAHVFGVERGERLIPVVMVGAVLGGLVGPVLYAGWSGSLGRAGLMLVASALLVATLPLTARMRPFPGQPEAPRVARRAATPFAGIVQVFGDRYLLLLAAMAVLMNCVNTTGEFMLADFVVRLADERVGENPALVREALIGGFYANYYLSINVLTVVVQILLVQKLLQWIGVSGALLVLPVIALAGYGLIAFVPLFGLIRAVKLLENCTDYSLMNTARHALYLPLPCHKQFEGKTIVDTLFWRLGDLAQAGVVFAGLHWAGFGLRQFALLNMLLTLGWILIAIRLGRGYAGHTEPTPRVGWRGVGIALVMTAVACVAIVVPARAAAGPLAFAGESQSPRLVRGDHGSANPLAGYADEPASEVSPAVTDAIRVQCDQIRVRSDGHDLGNVKRLRRFGRTIESLSSGILGPKRSPLNIKDELVASLTFFCHFLLLAMRSADGPPILQ